MNPLGELTVASSSLLCQEFFFFCLVFLCQSETCERVEDALWSVHVSPSWLSAVSRPFTDTIYSNRWCTQVALTAVINKSPKAPWVIWKWIEGWSAWWWIGQMFCPYVDAVYMLWKCFCNIAPEVSAHTVPFSCLDLWTVVRAKGLLKEGASVHKKPASRVRPSPPQAQNMDQPYPWLMSSGRP